MRTFIHQLPELIALICIALAVGLYAWKAQVFVVISNSMSPAIMKGDLIIAKAATKYQKGDVISFKINDGVATHRVVAVSERGLYTKGDANSQRDSEIVPIEKVKGKMVFKIPLFGFLILALRSKVGFICIFVYLIWSLFFQLKARMHQNKKQRIGQRTHSILICLVTITVLFLTHASLDVVLAHAHFNAVTKAEIGHFKLGNWANSEPDPEGAVAPLYPIVTTKGTTYSFVERIGNGSFEQGVEHWKTLGDVSLSESSILLKPTAQNQAQIEQEITFPYSEKTSSLLSFSYAVEGEETSFLFSEPVLTVFVDGVAAHQVVLPPDSAQKTGFVALSLSPPSSPNVTSRITFLAQSPYEQDSAVEVRLSDITTRKMFVTEESVIHIDSEAAETPFSMQINSETAFMTTTPYEYSFLESEFFDTSSTWKMQVPGDSEKQQELHFQPIKKRAYKLKSLQVFSESDFEASARFTIETTEESSVSQELETPFFVKVHGFVSPLAETQSCADAPLLTMQATTPVRFAHLLKPVAEDTYSAHLLLKLLSPHLWHLCFSVHDLFGGQVISETRVLDMSM